MLEPAARSRISPNRCTSRPSPATTRGRCRPGCGRRRALRMKPTMRAAAALVPRSRQDRHRSFHRLRHRRSLGLAVAEHGCALSVPAHARDRSGGRGPVATPQRTKIPDRVEPGGGQQSAPQTRRRARRGGGAARRSLRRGPGRSGRQALRRLGDLAHRDRITRAQPAARTRDQSRRGDSGPQDRHDVVAAPQYRRQFAGQPYHRDYVQAADGLSRAALSPMCPAS